MILGIGVDLVHVPRVERALGRFAARFARRILDPEEFAEFEGLPIGSGSPGRRARFLAMRFAAKEAAAKALGTGFRGGVAPRQFGVRRTGLGAPFLVVNGRAAQTVAERGNGATLHLSLADENEYALAFVTFSSS